LKVLRFCGGTLSKEVGTNSNELGVVVINCVGPTLAYPRRGLLKWYILGIKEEVKYCAGLGIVEMSLDQIAGLVQILNSVQG